MSSPLPDSPRFQSSEAGPIKREGPPIGKPVSKTDEVAQKAFALTAEERVRLDNYKREFHEVLSPEKKAAQKITREFIYERHRPIVECLNIARLDDLENLIVASRQPLQASNYQQLSHSRDLLARKDTFNFKVNNFEGVCLAAVFSFFKEAYKNGNGQIAAQKFKEGMPHEAHKYQSICQNFSPLSEKTEKALMLIQEILGNGETDKDMDLLNSYGEEYVAIYNQLRNLKAGSRLDPEFVAKFAQDLNKTFFIALSILPQILRKEMEHNHLSIKPAMLILEILDNGETDKDMDLLNSYGEEYVAIYNQVRDLKAGSRLDPEFVAKLTQDLDKTFLLVLSLLSQKLRKEMKHNAISFLSGLFHFKIAMSLVDTSPDTTLETISDLREGFYLITVPVLDNKGIMRRSGHAMGLLIGKEGAYFFDPNFGIIHFDLESDKNKIEFMETVSRNLAFYSGKSISELQQPGAIERALNIMNNHCSIYKVEPQTDEVAQKAFALTAEERVQLDNYKREFHLSKIRELIYGRHQPIVECLNIARLDDLENLIVASRQPLQASNHDQLAHSQKDIFNFKVYDFEGVYLAAVFSFFKETYKKGSGQIAAQKFKEDMPLEAHKYQSMYKNFSPLSEKSDKAAMLILKILDNGETDEDMDLLNSYGEEYVAIYNQVRDFKASRLDPEFIAKLTPEDMKAMGRALSWVQQMSQKIPQKMRHNQLSFMSNLFHFKIAESLVDKDPADILDVLSNFIEGFHLITIPQFDNKGIMGKSGHAIGLVIDKEGAYLFDPNLGIIYFDLESDKNKQECFETVARNLALYSGKSLSELQHRGDLEKALASMGSRCCIHSVKPQ